MKKFEIFEDKSGGLTLVVFSDVDTVEYIHTGYEYTPGRLVEDIESIKTGADPAKEWDGCLDITKDLRGEFDNLQAFYEEQLFLYRGLSTEVVADNNGLYPNKMGRAASLEFGFKL